MNTRLSTYINTLNKMSDAAKAAFWYIVCNFLQKGITLLTTPLFTRMLTTDQYGVFSIYQSWYAIISIFATLNLSYGVYNKALTEYNKEKNALTASFLNLSSTITLLLLLLYFVNRGFWNSILGLPTVLVITMFLQLFFEPAFLFWAVNERYQYRYKKLIAFTLTTAIGGVFLSLAAVMLSTHKAEARIIPNAFLQIVFGFAFYIYIMIKGKRFFSRKYWSFALKFNVPLIPHYVSQTILNQADRIMISKLDSIENAAVYSVAYQISMVLSLLIGAINNSFIPFTYQSIKENKIKQLKQTADYIVILIGALTVLVTAAGPEIIKIFAAPQYYNAIWIIPPVTLSTFFIFLYSLFGNIEFYFIETKYVSIASCIGGLLNIILNYLAIPIFGYYAAGYTTLICYVIFTLLHYLFYLKVKKKHMPDVEFYNAKKWLYLSAAIILVMFFITLLYRTTLIRYSLILLSLLVVYWKRKKIIKMISWK
ncbi:lipopolysaccharide biosynthesis protein [Diplocloster modestus]|uniref:Oligosaccharide flippase family protein n=1 Tax=Diplocloster modestus TaxID=2850322 RepID=A0ABS6K3U2_9FIRM|nr:oligosaccharide flippase family protein [Diplocloster modestus]MBU9725194.1 oligosaccharide flippase family protein [Diplocloster modestus]